MSEPKLRYKAEQVPRGDRRCISHVMNKMARKGWEYVESQPGPNKLYETLIFRRWA